MTTCIGKIPYKGKDQFVCFDGNPDIVPRHAPLCLTQHGRRCDSYIAKESDEDHVWRQLRVNGRPVGGLLKELQKYREYVETAETLRKELTDLVIDADADPDKEYQKMNLLAMRLQESVKAARQAGQTGKFKPDAAYLTELMSAGYEGKAVAAFYYMKVAAQKGDYKSLEKELDILLDYAANVPLSKEALNDLAQKVWKVKTAGYQTALSQKYEEAVGYAEKMGVKPELLSDLNRIVEEIEYLASQLETPQISGTSVKKAIESVYKTALRELYRRITDVAEKGATDAVEAYLPTIKAVEDRSTDPKRMDMTPIRKKAYTVRYMQLMAVAEERFKIGKWEGCRDVLNEARKCLDQYPELDDGRYRYLKDKLDKLGE